MKKQIQLFMTADDEKAFSSELRAIFPSLAFIDGTRWGSCEPPARRSIEECDTSHAYLWNSQLFPELPIAHRADGTIDGPSSGVVVQFARSQICQDAVTATEASDREILTSGRLAWGGERGRWKFDEMLAFVKATWAILKAQTIRVANVEPATGMVASSPALAYRAGTNAARWLLEDRRRLLRDRATKQYFLPA